MSPRQFTMRVFVVVTVWLQSFMTTAQQPLSGIVVSNDRTGFVDRATGKPFIPWGFNYDHDAQGRLLEDYWETEWAKVETDFAAMKQLGGNVVRIHLQVGKFLSQPDQPNPQALRQLARLVRLAETTGLTLNLTGLGCYHKADVPPWYDELDEAGRWQAQARFWEAVADSVKDSPAIFCLDLMNEPVVPGGKRADKDWLGPPFGGKHFVQCITLDQKNRSRPEIARQWIEHLMAAIRKVNQRHLITVGLVDWSLDRPGLTSGFVPEKVAGKLDFISVHLYPKSGELEAASATLRGFAIGKPIVVEETFPLTCKPEELDEFIRHPGVPIAGWTSFYWGTPVAELKTSGNLGDRILAEWLPIFQKQSPASRQGKPE